MTIDMLKRYIIYTKAIAVLGAALTILLFLSGCCDVLCERQKHAEVMIKKVEAYRQETGMLPEKVTEIGIDDNQDHLSFYIMKSEDEYEVWYGLGVGTSKIYNSKTKKWREEG
jgi:hypothetical protein